MLATVVSESAKKSLQACGIPARAGRLGVEEFVALISEMGARRIIDASHPFAEEAHRTAMEAARQAGIPYIRYERPGVLATSHPLLTVVDSYEQAARIAKEKKGRIMLTTGVKTLPLFAQWLLGDADIELCCRVLPRKENMELCEKLGFSQKQIIAMQGPFRKELNAALYRHFQTTLMITKESGAVGAVDEKVSAALELGIEVILIRRPAIAFGEVYHSFAEVLQAIEERGGANDE